MTDFQTDNYNLLKLGLEFLSKLIWPLTILIMLWFFKKPLSSFFERLVKFNFKNSVAEIKMDARNYEHVKEEIDVMPVVDSEDISEKSIIVSHIENESELFNKVYNEIISGKIESAKKLFVEYSIYETNQKNLVSNESIYHYLMYVKAGERDSIQKLLLLYERTSDENGKIDALFWLSRCYVESNNFEANIQVWSDAIPIFKESKNITICNINYAIALKNVNNLEQSLSLLKDRLQKIESSEEKTMLYKNIAIIEELSGNNEMASFCKEKLVQLDPDNKDVLFDAAYFQGDNEFGLLSVCNYMTLLNIDSDNSAALNNLGVSASQYKFNIKSYDFYEKSKKLGNTLAHYNIGSKLLEIGFHREALNIANEAFLHENVHKNVHMLISNINDRIEKEEEKWNEFTKSALLLREKIRKYTDCYYKKIENSAQLYDSKWCFDDGQIINFTIDENKIVAKWNKSAGIGASNIQCSISGKYKNASAKLVYKEIIENQYASLMINQNKEVQCYLYLDCNYNICYIFSFIPDEKFELSLKRVA